MTHHQLKVNIALGYKTVRQLTSNKIYKNGVLIAYFPNNFNDKFYQTNKRFKSRTLV